MVQASSSRPTQRSHRPRHSSAIDLGICPVCCSEKQVPQALGTCRRLHGHPVHRHPRGHARREALRRTLLHHQLCLRCQGFRLRLQPPTMVSTTGAGACWQREALTLLLDLQDYAWPWEPCQVSSLRLWQSCCPRPQQASGPLGSSHRFIESSSSSKDQSCLHGKLPIPTLPSHSKVANIPCIRYGHRLQRLKRPRQRRRIRCMLVWFSGT